MRRDVRLMIKDVYDDDKTHVHVLSYGGGTQSTAMLLMALKGEINGVIPDYIIFADTGWEPKRVYDWVDKVNTYIKKAFNREIIFTSAGNIREDTLKKLESNEGFVQIPVHSVKENGDKSLGSRQCTGVYKIRPIDKKIRQLLGYAPRKRIKEVVHVWKGISTDEIARVKPSQTSWQVAEHPLVEVANVDRSACVAYVEREGLGTPAKSHCIGCPFNHPDVWREMKRHDPESFQDAVYVDKMLRANGDRKVQSYLYKKCVPLDEADFQDGQFEFDLFDNECEGMCGL